MSTRRFNTSAIDKELADLRRRSSTPQQNDSLTQSINATATSIGAGQSGKAALGAGSRPPTALYTFLRDDFRPTDAKPVLSKSLAQQVKELRKLESTLDDDEVYDYRYDEESAFKEKLRGLGSVVTHSEMYDDDGGGVDWGTKDEKATSAAPPKNTPAGVDADGNMACGTDDLEDYIQSQKSKQRETVLSQRETIKTVSEVPRSIAEMALGAPFTDDTESRGQSAGKPSLSARLNGVLLATSARGPILNIVPSVEPTSASNSKSAVADSLVPSPPRASKPSTATNTSNRGATNPFEHDIYSLKPTSASGGLLPTVRPPKLGSLLPSQTVKQAPTVVGVKTIPGNSKAPQPAPPKTEKLYVHTEYLGDNGVAFCPNCRHCIDVAQQKYLQNVTKTEQLKCPKCNQLWIDQRAVEEQRQIEDEEAQAFQQAVLEWRKNANVQKQETNALSTISTAKASAVGTSEHIKPKGVRVPKGLYFQHLWKCVEAAAITFKY